MAAATKSVDIRRLPQQVPFATADSLYEVEPNEYRVVRQDSATTGYMPMWDVNGNVFYSNSIRGAWNLWFNGLMPQTLGDYNLFRRQHRIQQTYMEQAREEAAQVPRGETVLAPEPYHVKLCLDSPSLATLNEVRKFILLSFDKQDRLMNLLRLSTVVRDKTYGTLYGGTLRTPDLDASILKIIENFVIAAEENSTVYEEAAMAYEGNDASLTLLRYANDPNNANTLMDELYLIFSNNPILFVAKSYRYYLKAAPTFDRGRVIFPRPGQGEEVVNTLPPWNDSLERPLPSEYRILQYISALTSKLGLLVVPAAYGLKRIEGVTVDVPSGMREDSAHIADILANAPSMRADADVLYMQYLEGPTLDRVPLLSDELRNATVAYIHHVLAYLVKQCDFTHGDLTPRNILLWGYAARGERSYELPLIDSDGKLIEYIALPFRPMLVGLDKASTSTYAQYTATSSTHPGELSDIIRLYTTSEYPLRGMDYIVPRLAPYYEEFAQGISLDGAALPPYGWAIPEVNHEALSSFYRGEGVFKPFVVVDGAGKIADSVPLRFGQRRAPTYSLNFRPASQITSVPLATRAKALLKSFPRIDEISRNIVLIAVRDYLVETASHYGMGGDSDRDEEVEEVEEDEECDTE